jgi:hypothetical protein
MRDAFPEMSERNFARYWSCVQLFREVLGDAEHGAAVRASTRPNGSFNVARFERETHARLMRWLDEQDES